MDPFDNKILFLPMIEDLHWSLIVVVNPGLVANNFDADTPDVPYQGNGFDGGTFVCRYAYSLYVMRQQQFTWADALEKPAFTSLITNGPAFQFDMSDMARIRGELALLIDRLTNRRDG
ncbi:hypothetical protein ACHAXT_003500 [Thalassiosira profunda]